MDAATLEEGHTIPEQVKIVKKSSTVCWADRLKQGVKAKAPAKMINASLEGSNGAEDKNTLRKSKSLIKSCFKLSDICLGISLQPTCMITFWA